MTSFGPSGATGPEQLAAQAFRTLALVLVSTPVVVLLAVSFAADPAEEDLPTWVVATVTAGVAIGWLLAQTIGFRVPALATGDGHATALQHFRQSMVLRFVLTEAPVIVALAATFVLPYGVWTYVAAVVVGVPSMLLQVWPSRRVVDKVATRLESGGVPSGLREAFGHR